MILEDNTLPPIDRRDQHKPVLPPISHPSSMLMPGPPPQPDYGSKHELPPIATLPVPLGVNELHEMSQTLAPLRNHADMQPPSSQRRRTSSAASTKGRQNGYGSKIVACNFCRGAYRCIVPLPCAHARGGCIRTPVLTGRVCCFSAQDPV